MTSTIQKLDQEARLERATGEQRRHTAEGVETREQIASLRIGVFGIRTIPSTYSGYETFCNVLLPELASRGHDVTLFTREKFGRQKSYNGVKKIGLPSIRTKQLDTLSHSGICAAVSRFGEFDVILSFNVANAISLFLLTKTGVPTVLNVDGQEWKRGKWGSLAKKVFYNCGKISKYTSSRLVTDCVEMGVVYRNEFDADSVVIPYCWTGLLSEDELDKREDEFLHQFGIRAGNYLITGGRLVPENNIAEIVESHISSDVAMPIAVLGEANYDSPVQKRLNALASRDDRVKLLGHIDDRKGFGILLRDAFAYIHGHSVGGINPSIVEAMGVGAMICAFDTPFNREALGEAGVYFTNPNSAVGEMVSLVQASDAKGLRSMARERVKEIYSQEKIVDMYEDVLFSTSIGSQQIISVAGLDPQRSVPVGSTRCSKENPKKARLGLNTDWHDLASTIPHSFYRGVGKRIFDILGSAALLLFLWPVLLVIAILVRVKLGKGVVYKQRRVGRYGKTFNIRKFRTMLTDRRSSNEAFSIERRTKGHKTDSDPRHTEFGKQLRRFGIDEILQLINVIKGDMSLVGPRPELSIVAQERGYVLHLRHLVRPGITGPYQLSKLRDRGDLSAGLEMDKTYVQNLTISSDFVYLMRTPFVLFSRRSKS